MLHLVYGSAVSKRDEFLIKKMIEEADQNLDTQYIFLAPEQMSMALQDACVKAQKNHALYNIDILSFNRLSYHIFNEMNVSEKDILDDNGKMMLLRLVSMRVKKELSIFKNNLNKKGFIEELKSLISELTQYNITPDMLEKEIQNFSDEPRLQEKLKDVLIIYKEFLMLLHKDYEMAEERLQHLSAVLPDSSEVKKMVFILMGYTGFTPPQYDVLKELLSFGKEVYLSVPLGSELETKILSDTVSSDEKSETSLFYMPLKMAAEMKNLAISIFAPRKGYDEIFISDELSVSNEMKHIEKNLYRKQVSPFHDETGFVHFVRVKNRKMEVSMILSMILSDIRNGYSFSDLAVISGSLDVYRDEIEDQFLKAEVPLFMDQTKSISEDPLLSLLSDLLTMEEKNFSFDETISFMKNPLMLQWLSDIFSEEEDFLSPYERICELENYVRATGIRGRKMYEEKFTRRTRKKTEARMIYIEETKNIVLEPVFRLFDVFSDKEKNTGEKISEIVLFLEEIGAYETMQILSEREDTPILKSQYSKSYEFLMGLFDHIYRILGETLLPFDEFSEVLKTGMASLKLSIVPPTKNRLLVGDLLRTRLSNVKKLYILGANEEVLLVSPKEGGLLSDLDREYLKEKNLTLSETAKQEIFNRKYYLYLLLTKPVESITMTYASASMDGKSLEKDALIEVMNQMFPSVKEESISEDSISLLSNKSHMKTLLSTLLREKKEEMEEGVDLSETKKNDANALFQFFSERDEEMAKRLLSSAVFSYNEPHISEEVALKLYGDAVSGSVSRLEGFSSCPYKHFLTYGLKLQEDEVYTLSDADYGTIFHDGIEAFFRLCKDRHEKWDELSEENLEKFVNESVIEVTERSKNSVLSDSERNQYLVNRVKRLTLRTLWALKYQWNTGNFNATETERTFKGGVNFPALSFQLDSGRVLNLEGRIDRVDTVIKDDKVYVKIIDYKSGTRSIDYTKIYYGLSLQLLVYMEAMRAVLKMKYPEKEIIPSGVYYYHINDPVVELKGNKSATDLILSDLRMNGISNVDEDNLALIDEDLYSGNVTYSNVVSGLKRDKESVSEENCARISGDEFKKVSAYSLTKIKELTDEMLHGEIGIHPYAYKKDSGCMFCSFKNSCHFDTKLPGFTENRLAHKTLSDLLGGEQNGMDQ